LWAYILAHTGYWTGEVEVNPLIVAAVLGEVGAEQVEAQLEIFCQPDVKSRTPDDEGRRLRRIDSFNYKVVNWESYRDQRRLELRREQTREAMKRLRARRGEHDVSSGEPCEPPNTDTDTNRNRNDPSHPLYAPPSQPAPQAPSPTEGGKEKRERKVLQSYKADAGFMAIWEAYPSSRRVGALKAFEALVAARKRPDYPGDSAVLESLKVLVEEDWQFREPKYIKHPTTWLNSDGWEDVPAPPSWDQRRELAKKRAVSGHYDMNAKIDPKLGI
jgi:hypothetical protein